MVEPRRRKETEEAPLQSVRVLIVESGYYEDIAEMLLAGAKRALDAAGVGYDVVTVPGALEIPQAMVIVLNSAFGAESFDGVVALGCVIRGETSHYETVCANANHWLMDIATRHAIPLGNAILTVENETQALARAEGGRRGKGADAVRACLALIGHARAFAAKPA
jgi:6,7-dimethyl-8-ribityllumazine synthase